jgi:predicted nucleic acid-binding protein
VQRARECGVPILVPSVVVGEWWRGRTDWREKILAAVLVEPVDASLAKIAGEAVAAVGEATLIDAVVMAVAARAAGLVYTSDFDDLTRLQRHFSNVRVLSV